MTVDIRDVPEVRRRRRLVLAAIGAVAALAAVWALSARGEASRLSAGIAEAGTALADRRAEADRIADDCGIPPFSGEEALERFPIELSARPTKKEMDCARRVGDARADLIELHLRIDRARPMAAAASAKAGRRGLLAAVLGALFAAGILLVEILPRRGGASPGGAGRRDGKGGRT